MFHYDEFGQLREADYERQEILQRAGWTIHRIPARRYFLDPEAEVAIAMQVVGEQPTETETSATEFEDLSFAEVAPEEQPAGRFSLGCQERFLF